MGVRMTDEAAATIEDRFDNLSQDFWNLMDMTPTARTDIEEGCGEFSSDMAAYRRRSRARGSSASRSGPRPAA